ncbi:hypothetical protein JCM19053_1824 [Vibrio sp. JCM 19053]|nr:hypothetical protein JCM19053_1824 [Vibrio sp. JCM 19053]
MFDLGECTEVFWRGGIIDLQNKIKRTKDKSREAPQCRCCESATKITHLQKP